VTVYEFPSIYLIELYVLIFATWLCRFFSFYMEVNETVAAMHPIRCLKQRKVDLDFDLTKVLGGVVVVVVVLWLLLRRRRPKPKIN
jgi:hypothetical protein